MKKQYKLKGTMYNRYEIIKDGDGNEVKTIHIGIDDGGTKEFANTLETIVPNTGDTQEVEIIFNLIGKK